MYDTLSMTVAAGTVALDIVYEGLLLGKSSFANKHAEFKSRELKPYPI